MTSETSNPNTVFSSAIVEDMVHEVAEHEFCDSCGNIGLTVASTQEIEGKTIRVLLECSDCKASKVALVKS